MGNKYVILINIVCMSDKYYIVGVLVEEAEREVRRTLEKFGLSILSIRNAIHHNNRCLSTAIEDYEIRYYIDRLTELKDLVKLLEVHHDPEDTVMIPIEEFV